MYDYVTYSNIVEKKKIEKYFQNKSNNKTLKQNILLELV